VVTSNLSAVYDRGSHLPSVGQCALEYLYNAIHTVQGHLLPNLTL
jgi:hypothetical protein